ncbi:MAG TPA: potassium-transporting ATPase subunit KdpA [bacterium]|nr:potassium-transporting ATPase subunit KdpA [bacterium]
MTLTGWLQIGAVLAVLLVSAKPLGAYMARVYAGERTLLDPVLRPVERLLYRCAGVQPEHEMDWRTYTVALLSFTLAGMFLLYAMLRLQAALPLNPQRFPSIDPMLAFNTAASYVSATEWQNFGGETAMSYLTQIVGFVPKAFVSGAGMAIMVALFRGIVRVEGRTIGNFWVDLVRGTLYIFLPLAAVLAVFLASQGVVQTFSPYKTATLVEPTSYEQPITDASGKPVLDAQGHQKTTTVKVTEQQMALGPMASVVAIRQFTNGGGFTNVNSAHPFENPTPLSNFFETIAMALIPIASCYMFGRMVGNTRQGWALIVAMTIIFMPLLVTAVGAEQAGNPLLTAAGVDQQATASQPGGNMEGKEVRFGIAASALWGALTTAASNGSANSMYDSYTPAGGFVPLFLMHTGEVVYGGVGSGMYGMLVYVIVAAFVAGLMIGRRPEYLGKKIEAFEMKMATLVVLVMPAVALAATAIAVLTTAGRAGIFNPGPHGFTEILYAFTSMANNNGSAFAGLNGNTPFYNLVGAVVMLAGRFWVAIPALAMAGSFVGKRRWPASAGTLPTDTWLFVLWLVTVIIIVGTLSFLPALALGPLVEHFLMGAGTMFK